MPFERILDNLVHRVDDAYGVVFLDDEGEVIVRALNGHGMETDALDFIGARQGLVIDKLRNIVAATEQGSAQSITLAGEQHTILTQVVEDDYFLVLVIDPGVTTGRADFEMGLAVRELREALS